MKKYEVGKRKKIIALFALLLMLQVNPALAFAANISTLPNGSGNDVPLQESSSEVPTEPPAVQTQPEVPAQESSAPVEPVPEVPADPGISDPQPPAETAPSETEEQSLEETEDSTADSTDSSREESSMAETSEESTEETWPMGFSGAGDGQTTEEAETAQSAVQTIKKEGGSTIAKVIAAIVMLLLIGGVVFFGYRSMVAREEFHRRERRARAWSDYGDEDDE